MRSGGLANLNALGHRAWAEMASGVLTAIFPTQCLSCGSALEDPASRYTCDSCWRAVRTLGDHVCRCGLPLAPSTDACGICAADPDELPRGSSVFSYESPIRELIHAFKFGGRHRIAAVLIDNALRHASPAPGTLLVPVPPDPLRFIFRRFNSATVLAREIGGRLGLDVAHILRKTRRTPRQATLGAKDRAHNLRGAFEVRRGMRPLAFGASVTVVDDVFTTGSTVRECVSALRTAGAREVRFYTIARRL